MWRALARLLTRFDGRDLTTAAGLVLMAAGLALVSIPAALIVPGALLFLLATWPLLVPGRRAE